MKKILLLIIFSTSYSLFSQIKIPQEYIISKPLRLETVNSGNKSDSLLVRGSDKILKYVPQSSLKQTPNLDQVLGKGQLAMDHTIYLLSSGEYYSAYGPTEMVIFNKSEDSRLDFKDYEISKQNGKYEFHLNFNRTPATTTYNNFIFPQKPDGSYTLATTDDLPQQKVKTYLAWVNIYGTGNITINEIYNDTGATATFSPTANPGQFIGTFSNDIFTRKKVVYWVGNTNITDLVRLSSLGDNSVIFGTSTYELAAQTGFVPSRFKDMNITNVQIKIEIYP